jgi:hypothetical protein
MVISLVARGLTTGDGQARLAGSHGAEASRDDLRCTRIK